MVSNHEEVKTKMKTNWEETKVTKEACLEKLEANNQKLSRNLAKATEDWEILVCAIVNSKVCKLAIVL
jgi:hypothetical protein